MKLMPFNQSFPNNMNSYQTPQKSWSRDFNFGTDKFFKAAGYASKDIQPQFLNTPNEISTYLSTTLMVIQRQ